LVAASQLGNFYVYDSVGPVADLLQQQRGFSDTQVGLQNAIYNLPNVVLILVGGVLVDRFGAALMTLLTAGICLAGALLTALGPDFTT
ncbi:MFS transporter, partial [Proteus mirabilis]|uniref:MFS transporter n=1 Tax=Proteus mirabilis TaxID=584 RepID=UPI0013D11F27